MRCFGRGGTHARQHSVVRVTAPKCWALPRLQRRSRLSTSESRLKHTIPHADAAASFGSSSNDGQTEEIKVFPRLKEKDPFKVLGIPSDSDFEEIQAARNYLYNEYRAHEASREHVEWAFETVGINATLKKRQKQGYRPGRNKRGERVEYQAPPTLGERIKAMIDPSSTLVTFVNELVIFALIGVWSMYTVPENNLPIMLTFAYATWKTFSKRMLRNPDGPYLGNSALWGSLLYTVVCMALSVTVAEALKLYCPFWRVGINEIRAAAFLIPVLVCPFNVFLK